MKQVITLCMISTILLAANGAPAGSFPWDSTAVNLGHPWTDGQHDDIEGDPLDRNIVYVTKIDTGQIGKIQLTRSAGGKIIGSNLLATIDTEAERGFGYWVHDWPKAIAPYTTNIVYVAAEEGQGDDRYWEGPAGTTQTQFNDTDGSIYRLDFSKAPGTAGRLTTVADLTNVRTGSTAAFDPEGVIVDRTNNYLYVTTDDGPNNDIAQYGINPADGSLSFNWVVSMEVSPAQANGRTGSLTPWGDVLAVAGKGTDTKVFLIKSDGTVSNPFGSALSGFSAPQDVIYHDGFVYVADKGDIIAAYDWNSGSPSTTPDATWDIGTMLGEADLTIGGMGLTIDGDLLVSTRAGATYESGMYVFAIPEPATLGLLAIGGLGVLIRRKRK